MTPVNPTDRLTVTLEAQQWLQILGLVAEAPYRVAAPLIRAVDEQLQAAQTRPADNIIAMDGKS